MLQNMNVTISSCHIFHHLWSCLFIALRETLKTKKRGRGLKRRIWRLILTVGWLEKSISVSTIPAKPVIIIKTASKIQKWRLVNNSEIEMIIVMARKIRAQTVGDNGKFAVFSISPWGNTVRVCLTSGFSWPFSTMTAFAKSFSKLYGRNCCSLRVVVLSACTPRRRSLPARLVRWAFWSKRRNPRSTV